MPIIDFRNQSSCLGIKQVYKRFPFFETRKINHCAIIEQRLFPHHKTKCCFFSSVFYRNTRSFKAEKGFLSQNINLYNEVKYIHKQVYLLYKLEMFIHNLKLVLKIAGFSYSRPEKG